MDEHLVTGLPALEPYARLFHRYYAIASPSATRRLLLGLLEAPPSWAPDALDAIVQLLELLRAAEDYASRMRVLVDMILLPDWVFESAAQELRVMEQDATPHHPRIYLSDAQTSMSFKTMDDDQVLLYAVDVAKFNTMVRLQHLKLP
ncbi:uncharacterized protein LOC111910240 isoform X1 [Lactuca sativa]|uniref:uncharacterized protein LOC111910240 isoform X1 n=1 Tax=Lactuca sativa TaxID=4236 RepID=UPI000CD8880A|nr:uncharacterized protein LOC111910240 isoform X1 [Lactuca sativa]XP_023761812.1 uncharacterized protein LOC111910240 isoform X1 [Lactuca sativa]XP_023761813.1 uncharacterized protein LOC111910240 isoform X1 [Lactuca sativa]